MNRVTVQALRVCSLKFIREEFFEVFHGSWVVQHFAMVWQSALCALSFDHGLQFLKQCVCFRHADPPSCFHIGAVGQQHRCKHVKDGCLVGIGHTKLHMDKLKNTDELVLHRFLLIFDNGPQRLWKVAMDVGATLQSLTLSLASGLLH